MTVREDMISFILAKTPLTYSKENWLGVKLSPHQSIEFINKIDSEGVVTNRRAYSWGQCFRSNNFYHIPTIKIK